MHLVVVHHWSTDDQSVAQKIAAALGMVAFDVRQRLTGGGPAVMASFADLQRAVVVAERLNGEGVPALLIDTGQVRAGDATLHVRRFLLAENGLQVETADGGEEEYPYAGLRLMLAATVPSGEGTRTVTVTESKLSLGKTLIAGGIPMHKKVKREVMTPGDERDEVLCLYAAGRRPLGLYRAELNYAGLGAAMQMSRPLNFAYLKSELARRAPQAVVDTRLLQRAGQARLLGPSFDPDRNFDLACEILVRTLLRDS